MTTHSYSAFGSITQEPPPGTHSLAYFARELDHGTRRHRYLILLVISQIYFALGLASYAYSEASGAFAESIYLHEGIALAVGLLFGWRVWPSIAVGHFMLVVSQGNPPVNALLITAANILVLFASLGFLQFFKFSYRLASLRDFALLVVGCLIPYQMFSRSLGMLVLILLGYMKPVGGAAFYGALVSSLLDQAVCQLLVTTLILTSADALICRRSFRYWIYGVATTALVATILIALIWRNGVNFHPLHILSLVYLLVMTVTFIFDLHGAAAANLILLLTMQLATHMRLGPLHLLLGSTGQEQNLNTSLIGIVLSAGFVGALMREKNDKERELIELATRDVLTGLYNRRHFFEAAHREFSRASRDNSSLVLFWIDLDRFKLINDTKGHAAGDAVLALMGEILNDECRRSDVAARMGGEEFALLAYDANDPEAIAEKLRVAVKEQLERHPDVVPFTISIGVSRVQAGDRDIHAALQRADAALYKAKQRGRDCVVIHETEDKVSTSLLSI